MHDVCVIGAGPSGSACALKLGENYKTSLIEKDEFGGKTNVCAGGLDVLTLEKLDLGEEAIEKRLDGLIIKDSKGLISEKKLECISVQRSVFD